MSDYELEGSVASQAAQVVGMLDAALGRKCQARLHGRDGVTIWHCHRPAGHPMTPPLPLPDPNAEERNMHYGEDLEPGHPMGWRDSAKGAIPHHTARWLDGP